MTRLKKSAAELCVSICDIPKALYKLFEPLGNPQIF